MRRALIRLYPAAWRARYGAELETLMADMPGGWRGDFDVLKGALGMRLKYQSGWGIVLGLAVAGVLVGWLASYAVPQQWEAKAVVQITPTVISESSDRTIETQGAVEEVKRLKANVTSRQSLAKLMMDPRLDLYRNVRAKDPLESIEDTMRESIKIQVMATPQRHGAAIFTISFTYPDREKALATVNALITRFIMEGVTMQRGGGARAPYYLDTLDPPYVPQKPISPNRRAIMAAGGFGGLTLAFIILVVRRSRSAKGPDLQAA